MRADTAAVLEVRGHGTNWKRAVHPTLYTRRYRGWIRRLGSVSVFVYVCVFVCVYVSKKEEGERGSVSSCTCSTAMSGCLAAREMPVLCLSEPCVCVCVCVCVFVWCVCGVCVWMGMGG